MCYELSNNYMSYISPYMFPTKKNPGRYKPILLDTCVLYNCSYVG